MSPISRLSLLLLHSAVTEKADVFAFGVLLAETLFRLIPWVDLELHQVTLAVAVEQRRPYSRSHLSSHLSGSGGNAPARVAEAVFILAERCWAQDPGERPSFDDVLISLDEISMEL